MHIDDLPSEVLILILRQVFWYNPNRLKQWKVAIPSMAVCRKWRSIVLHHAHRRLIVEPKHQYSYVELYANNLLPTDDGLVKLVESTVDIIPPHLVTRSKQLVLNIDYKIGYVKVIRFAIMLLYRYSSYISSTTRLMICNIGGVFSNNRAQYHFGDSISEVRSLANTLVRLCPNIHALRFRGMSNHIILSTFAQTVALCYKQQLGIISASTECIVLAPDSFKSISSLEIEKSSRSWDFLPIDPKSLKQLTISRYSDGFFWTSFESNCTPGIIDFQNLRNLTINMHFDCGIPEMTDDPVIWLGPSDKIQHKIIAPKLTTIDVELCPFACSLFASIVCSDPLDKLTIRIPCGIRLEFYGFDLSESTKSLFLAYSENSTGVIDDNMFLNDILSRTDLADMVSMEMFHPHYVTFTSHANWNSVGFLKIHNRTDLVELLQTISQMPNIISIHAKWVCIGFGYTDSDYLHRVRDFFLQLPKPLSTSIKHMTLRFMPSDIPNLLSELLISSLHTCTPSLESLIFDKHG